MICPPEITKLSPRSDNEAQTIIDKDPANIPLYLHYEHVTSNFVRVTILLSTASIPMERRPLLSLFIENFFSTPVMRDGVRLEFDQVVAQLEKDTVDYNINSGAYMESPESIRIRFQIEPDKYETTIKWLRELMWSSIFDKKVYIYSATVCNCLTHHHSALLQRLRR